MKPLTSAVWKHFSNINSDSEKCSKWKKTSISWLSSNLKTYKITTNETVTNATFVAETDY
jgi:hypothetical protein